MSLLYPPKFQPPFAPMERQSIPVRVFTAVERTIKGALSGCCMCGNCILQETAFVCPMTCPKGLGNGLCGGASPDHCEVDPSRPCTWYTIYERAERLGRLDKLLEINAPIDGARTGRETWLDMLAHWRELGEGPHLLDLVLDREKFTESWDHYFYTLRQPEWWQGYSEYHPPTYELPVSQLEANLRISDFVVTAEIAPPSGISGDIICKKVDWLRDYVTTANFTDNASAAARITAWPPAKSAAIV